VQLDMGGNDMMLRFESYTCPYCNYNYQFTWGPNLEFTCCALTHWLFLKKFHVVDPYND